MRLDRCAAGHTSKIALRTQQIIADETGVTGVIDPLGGSYYVESLTDRLEHGIAEYLEKIEELGGVVAAIEQGFFQREISDSAYDYARRKASGDRPVIGVNKQVGQQPLQGIMCGRPRAWREPHAGNDRCGPGPPLDGRDHRRAARNLRHLHRTPVF